MMKSQGGQYGLTESNRLQLLHNYNITTNTLHCVKSFRIRSYSGPNAGKCGPE